MSALQRAKRRIEDLELREREPIAVIGVGCRFPGGPTLAAFWETLCSGRDPIREVPASAAGGPLAGRRAAVGRSARRRPFSGFDAAFFGISAA